jgi:Holliday junction DNA helicase RuvB
LLRRVRDYAVVHGTGRVDLDSTEAALALYDVDSLGLDRLDRAILHALVNKFAGKAVGLSTLAVVVGEEADTIEAVVEPYLIREGLMLRTPRGRQATPAAFRHLGLTDSSPRLQGLEDL